MQQEKILLKVGYRLYKFQHNSIVGVVEIGRVTKTQAISECGSYKFRIEMSNPEYIICMGRGEWDSSHFKLETPELKDRLKIQKNIARLIRADFSQLPTECINELVSVLDKYSPLKK